MFKKSMCELDNYCGCMCSCGVINHSVAHTMSTKFLLVCHHLSGGILHNIMLARCTHYKTFGKQAFLTISKNQFSHINYKNITAIRPFLQEWTINSHFNWSIFLRLSSALWLAGLIPPCNFVAHITRSCGSNIKQIWKYSSICDIYELWQPQR